MRTFFSNRWLAVIAALLLYSLAGTLPAGQGLLYALSRPGLPTSYLLGTMHSDAPAVLDIAERAAPQRRAAGRVVLEIPLDDETRLQAARGMMLPDGQRLSMLLSAEEFRQALDAGRDHGLSAAMVDRLKPWALAVTLSLPPRQGRILDEVIAQQARRAGKPVIGLERADEQLSPFDTLPPGLQQVLLRETLQNLPGFPAQWQALQAAYLAGDLDRLQALSAEQTDAIDPRLAAWFDAQIIDARNHRMRARLLPLLEAGPCFVAVGALHLPGEAGLLAGLREAGFQVDAIW